MKNKNQKRIYIFLASLLIFTTAVSVLSSFITNQNLWSVLIMWTPGLAALLVSFITKRSLKQIGWKLSLKWMLAGWLFPVVYATVAYSAVWIFSFGDVPNPTFLERARLTLGIDSGSDSIVIISAFFYITVVNLLPAAVMALGEEIGWRGFLVPELTAWIGLKKAGWISGIIWGVWHLPGILTGNYAQQGTPLWFQLTCFFILVISTAIILAWLRMKSGSILPAVIFHATHNGVVQMFYNRITIDTGNTNWFTGEFGFALVPVLILISIYVLKRMDKMQKIPM
ncbi:MAG: CPBP family intramembrane metalloprotease [Prolixibacteraceae bacterium]|nr:CPBP family intramembrane metalloprotease [Prolixibacteraceae bacterium]